MYFPDPNHDRAVEIALEMNERYGRKSAAADRIYDRSFYRIQRALGRIEASAKPCGEPTREGGN
jgi:hypothetical protein